jgi:hypothetical protein
MLSKLSKTEFKLFRLIRHGRYLKGLVDPVPKISMRKQVHSQQGDQIRKGPAEFGSKLEEPQDQHRNQCCPNLNLNGIGTGAYKGLDLQILFQSPEEGLYSPTVFVNAGNGRGPQNVMWFVRKTRISSFSGS